MLETIKDWNLLSKQALDPLGDGKSSLQLVDYMGGDLAIVNDARASYEKVSTELKQKDIDLILFLITHQHLSPLRGTVFKFKVRAPIFVCRQFWKHAVASSHIEDQLQHNEKSFRYREALDSEDYYLPSQFSAQSKTNKQGSSGTLEPRENALAIAEYQSICDASFLSYQRLIDLGVSREQARGVLAPAFYTSWVWTCSLQSLLNFIQLRKGEGAQSEIRFYAEALEDLIRPIVPYAIAATESTEW